LTGGPHENAIAAIATTFKQASTPEFKEYAQQIVKNAQRLSDALQRKVCSLTEIQLSMSIFFCLYY